MQQFRKFKLLLTDGACYNKAVAGTIKTLYPDLIHVTCYTHMVARLSAKIVETEKSVNSFLKNVKKVFEK